MTGVAATGRREGHFGERGKGFLEEPQEEGDSTKSNRSLRGSFLRSTGAILGQQMRGAGGTRLLGTHRGSQQLFRRVEFACVPCRVKETRKESKRSLTSAPTNGWKTSESNGSKLKTMICHGKNLLEYVIHIEIIAAPCPIFVLARCDGKFIFCFARCFWALTGSDPTSICSLKRWGWVSWVT